MKKILLFALLTLVGLSTSPLKADIYWDADNLTTGIQDGAGIWTTTNNNWWEWRDPDPDGNTNWNNVPADSAIFGDGQDADGATSYTVTVDAAGIDVHNLNFHPGPDYHLMGGELHFVPSGRVAVAGSYLITDWDGYIHSVVSDEGQGFYKAGGRDLFLYADNTLSGVMVIGAGDIWMHGNATNATVRPTAGFYGGTGTVDIIDLEGGSTSPGFTGAEANVLSARILELNAGGTYYCDINGPDSGTPGVNWDVISVAQTTLVNIASGSVFNIQLNINEPVSSSTAHSWEIISGAEVAGFTPELFNVFAYGLSAEGLLFAEQVGGSIYATYEPVAEFDLFGNGQEIFDGATAANTGDGTDFGSLLSGGTRSHTFSINNPGAQALTIAGSSITGPNASDFSIIGLPTTVDAGATSNFVIQFSPSTNGTLTATISIDSNDDDEAPYTFAVEGSALSLDDFAYKLEITLCGYEGGETLANFPVPVLLSTSISDFSYTGFASSVGADLRFTDGGLTTFLDHDVETWNTNGESILWVEVPQLVDSNTTIWAYWGNASVLAAPYPTNFPGMALWLRADMGVETNTLGFVTNWVDQSPNALNVFNGDPGNTLPIRVDNVLNGMPTVRFDGINDMLEGNLDINGNNHMTIFAVTRATNAYDTVEGYAAIHWTESAGWGQVFLSPQQNEVNWRFGTGQGGNLLDYFPPSPLTNFYLSTVTHRKTDETLYVNGNAVDGSSGMFEYTANNVSRFTVGFSDWNDTTFDGDIAEIIVYTQELTAGDLADVGRYLNDKYGLGGNFSELPGFTKDGSAWGEYEGVWHFSDGSGSSSAKDSSSSGANGTLMNMDVNSDWTDGVIGGALDFGGTNTAPGDYVQTTLQVDESDENDDGTTFSAWVLPREAHSVWAPIFWTDNGGWDWFLGVAPGSGNYQYMTGGGSVETTNSVTSNDWQHVSLVYDTANDLIKFYLNGEFVWVSTGIVFEITPPGSGPLMFGGNSGFFDGIIDEPRVALTAKSDAWIMAEFLSMADPLAFACYAAVTTNGTPPIVVPDGDEDGDGMSDEYETTWFGGTTNGTASADDDNDGLDNLTEFILDFNPISVSNKLFDVVAGSGLPPSFSFGNTTNSRRYSVDYNSSIQNPTVWMLLHDGLTGSNGVMTVSDPGAGPDPSRVYRIRVFVP